MRTGLRRILVPLDGSHESEAALGAILPLVRADAPKVSFLCVLDASDIPSVKRPYDFDADYRAMGIEASLDMRIGRAADEILIYAREQQVDLIAMSTHGRSGLSRIRMGSVTEEVLRRSEVPLLVCRPSQPPRDWKRIVVALDGSPRAEQILQDAVRVARAMKSAMDIVHVALPICVAGEPGGFPVYSPSNHPGEYLEGVCARLREQGDAATPVALTGSAATEILRHAEAVGAGLLCMTSHGRTGLPRLLMGSIAEEILRNAPCPVLVRRMTAVAKPVEVWSGTSVR